MNLGNILIKGITGISGLILLLVSCGPDLPPPPPGIIRLLPATTVATGSTSSLLTDPPPDCPHEGTGCVMPWLYPIYPGHHHRLYAELQSAAAANDLSAFFINYPDWNSLMPGLDNTSPVYRKLVNGDYRLHFYSDSSISVYDPSITNDNVVLLFKFKGR